MAETFHNNPVFPSLQQEDGESYECFTTSQYVFVQEQLLAATQHLLKAEQILQQLGAEYAKDQMGLETGEAVSKGMESQDKRTY
jgi:hypothetical protein